MANLTQSVITATLPTVVETIEVRTRFSPPVVLRTADLLKPSAGPPSPAVRLVKPTIILRGGTVGLQTIAPAGVTDPDEWKRTIAVAGAGVVGVLAVAVAIVFSAGRRVGRKRVKALDGVKGVDLSARHVFTIGVVSSVVGGLITAKMLEPKT